MSKITVVLDPGHYTDYNKGAVSPYNEGSYMMKLAMCIKSSLEATGKFEVILTKNSSSENPSLTSRGKVATANKARIFISLHTDGFNDPSAKGVTVFRSIPRPNSEGLGVKLGVAIAMAMKEETGVTYFRGCKTRASTKSKYKDYYTVMSEAAKSSSVEYILLVEHGFHSNPEECAFLVESESMKKLANVYRENLYEFFVPEFQEENKPVVDESYIDASTYKVNTITNGFMTSDDAYTYDKSKTVRAVRPGIYKVFNTSKGMINVTTDIETPGIWINPKYNETYISNNRYEVVTPLKGYNTAADAMCGNNPRTTVSDGVYYIFNKKDKAVNVSFKEGHPGSWINTTLNKL